MPSARKRCAKEFLQATGRSNEGLRSATRRPLGNPAAWQECCHSHGHKIALHKWTRFNLKCEEIGMKRLWLIVCRRSIAQGQAMCNAQHLRDFEIVTSEQTSWG